MFDSTLVAMLSYDLMNGLAYPDKSDIIQLHLAAQHESPSLGAQAARAAGATSHIPWRMSSNRGPWRAERTTWIQADNTGCGPGMGAGRRRQSVRRSSTGDGRRLGRRSGRTGEAPDVDADTRYTLLRSWRRTRADGGGSSEGWAAPVDNRGPTNIEGPAGGVMSRLRCSQNADSDGRDLRFAGLEQHAGQHQSSTLMEQGERCRPGTVGSG